MNHPNPAIVAQSAVRRLPRAGLLALCTAYVLAGLIGRSPWRSADLQAFGHMLSLAEGTSSWLAPAIPGALPDLAVLLPYWLGALGILGLPFLPADVAARVPFGLLLALTLTAAWYATYHLARRPSAQPVAFAFGGEALPTDYARAMADTALLALLACLGLAQLSHETTAAQTQLGAAALAYYGIAAFGTSPWRPALAVLCGLLGLTLSGAPSVALLLGLAGAAIHAGQSAESGEARPLNKAWALLALALAASLPASLLALWQWRFEFPPARPEDWRSLGQMLLWFTWPCWPLVLWTLWRWRRQLTAVHLAVPLAVVAVGLGSAAGSRSDADRALLPALPALATLAAFALPTLRRSVAALIDWFTLVFFSFSAVVIWVYWIAMQTGWPRRPALTVARFAPGFEPSFSTLAFVVAIAATLAWIGLVVWRAGRHRQVIWKSLVLPAGGATLSWLLAMTLWMPLLDYVRSHEPLARRFQELAPGATCLWYDGLSPAQRTALRFHAGIRSMSSEPVAGCGWRAMVLRPAAEPQRLPGWTLSGVIVRPTDRNDRIAVYRQEAVAGPAGASVRP